MRYSSAIVASAALVAGASAWDNVTYTTEVVTAYTTYCPSATAITHGTHTYTVTEVSKMLSSHVSAMSAVQAPRARKCSEMISIVIVADSTYGQATTLTITNCPCTLTKPVYTAPIVYCSTW